VIAERLIEHFLLWNEQTDLRSDASLKIKPTIIPLIRIGNLIMELIKGENLGDPTFEGKSNPHTTNQYNHNELPLS